ncbi:MAG: PEF-CTERM sorting domain-containing protein, partial [Methanosarcinaceae archaeon]|nr:PEF-CTERM sorting domain-containing protein [Methanosarcinaceae archaeon]
YTDAPVCFQLVSSGSVQPISASFVVTDALLTETDELLVSIAGHAYASSDTATIMENSSSVNVSGSWTTTWDICVKDGADNLDDDSQVGEMYYIQYTVLYPTGQIVNGTAVTIPDRTHTEANAIPEFPTVALPIAAIIGLAFVFQHRKEE